MFVLRIVVNTVSVAEINSWRETDQDEKSSHSNATVVVPIPILLVFFLVLTPSPPSCVSGTCEDILVVVGVVDVTVVKGGGSGGGSELLGIGAAAAAGDDVEGERGMGMGFVLVEKGGKTFSAGDEGGVALSGGRGGACSSAIPWSIRVWEINASRSFLLLFSSFRQGGSRAQEESGNGRSQCEYVVTYKGITIDGVCGCGSVCFLILY